MIMDSNHDNSFFTLSSYNQYLRKTSVRRRDQIEKHASNSIRRVQSSSSDSSSGSPQFNSSSSQSFMIMDSNHGKFFFTLSSYNQYLRNSIRRVLSSSSDSSSGSPPPTSKSEKKRTPINLAWFQIFSSSKPPPLQSITSLSSPPIFYDFSEISNLIGYWDRNPSAPSWGAILRNKQVMIFRRKFHDTELPKSKLSIIFQSHPRLVKLLGTSDGHDHVYLIYDHSYMGISLKAFLQNPDFQHQYSLSMMQIVLDVAKGLDYIHRHCGLIHHEINSSNVIVTRETDSSCNAKICLFGAAYVADTNNKREFSKKSDVFDFGVLILELVSGKLMEKENILIELARDVVNKRKAAKMVDDQRLSESFPKEVAEKLIQLALKCVEPEQDKRPEMVQVASEISKLYSPFK